MFGYFMLWILYFLVYCNVQSLMAVVVGGNSSAAAGAAAERNSIKPSENNHRCEIVFIRLGKPIYYQHRASIDDCCSKIAHHVTYGQFDFTV